MQAKPIIGLNAHYRLAVGNQSSGSILEAGYYDSVQRAGGVPILLPPMDDDDNISTVLDLLDGIIFIGGPDLDPRRDGFKLLPCVRPMESRRENFDRKLMLAVADRRLPVFGIGVGMQLMNVTMGGNLFLHIPEDLPTAVPHLDPGDPGHRHSLEIEPSSLMERVYGNGEIRVSSRHHMAIDEVASGFRVTARCPDGVIEAIESDRDDWIAIGTQFHPENAAASALDVRVFEEWLDLIRDPAPMWRDVMASSNGKPR